MMAQLSLLMQHMSTAPSPAPYAQRLTACQIQREMRGGTLQRRTGEDEACIFFVEGKGCMVHEGKPGDECRAWPFFRSNIMDANSFEMARAYCPGVEKGRSHGDFAREGRACLTKHGLPAHSRDEEGRAVILGDQVPGPVLQGAVRQLRTFQGSSQRHVSHPGISLVLASFPMRRWTPLNRPIRTAAFPPDP